MSKVIPFPTRPAEPEPLCISSSGEMLMASDPNTSIAQSRVTVADMFTEDQVVAFAMKLSGFTMEQAIHAVGVFAEMMRQAECRRHNLPI